MPDRISRRWFMAFATCFVVSVSATAAEPGQATFAVVADAVNQKVVKLYGSGGFQSLPAYGTGVLVSPNGHVLTVASHILDTQDLRVHLHDGRRFHNAKVLVVEPELDAALVKIDKVEDLPYFDVDKAAKTPLAQAGDWVLGFSNQFHIATGDEPLSVQRGVIAAYSKLHGRRGVYRVPYQGNVYVLDAITNNPGAAGGALTTRKGDLLGVIGKELKNDLTDTWINYAVPVQELSKFVELGMQGKYKPIEKKNPLASDVGYHGIILIPNVVERTPPFVEEVIPSSPAAKAGLKPDDLIVYINGDQVSNIKAFRDMMAQFGPGVAVKLEVRRQEKLMSIDLTLAKPEVKTPPKK